MLVAKLDFLFDAIEYNNKGKIRINYINVDFSFHSKLSIVGGHKHKVLIT